MTMMQQGFRAIWVGLLTFIALMALYGLRLPPPMHLAVVQNSYATQTTHATCLSCLPGTFSYLDATQKQATGGPYTCQKCMQGTFSNSTGASACIACPVGKCASSTGTTACTSCGSGNYTVVPMAYSVSQCVNCLPGTGNWVRNIHAIPWKQEGTGSLTETRAKCEAI
jgi:hypothetical protein